MKNRTTHAEEAGPVTPHARDITTQAKRIRKPSKGTQAALVTTKPRRAPSAATTTVRPAYADLSFVSCRSSRGGWHCTSWFNVPEQEYGDGWMTGLQAFQELQQFVKTQPQGIRDTGLAHYVQWMLEEAFKAMENTPFLGKSKRGAAAAFVQCASQFLLAMLRSNDGRHMADRITAEQASNDRMNAYRADKRAEFIARMQAARAAKRAARGGAA